MPINSRRKGKVGEIEIAHILRERGYTEARRGQQYSGTETSADVVGLDGIHIEVKRVENLSLYTAYEQAVRDTGNSGDMPVVFHRRNNKPWLAICSLDDFLRLHTKHRIEVEVEQ